MALQKKIVKRSIPSSVIPKNELTWLVQPVAVTWMRYDYTLMQSKVFIRIISSLQFAIQESINNYLKKENKPLTLFTSNEFADESDPNVILLKIPIKDFGIHRNSYKQLKDALLTLVTIPIETPYKDKNGRNWTVLESLCSVIIPSTGKVTHVFFKIKRDTAERLLNLDFGFHRFIQEATFTAKNTYTPKIYLYLSVYKKQGGCEILMSELRKYLRLEDKYKVFKDFVKRVLAPVQEELKQQALNGISDFYFEYDYWYTPGRRKAGEPDKVIFKIIDSPTVQTISEKEELATRQRNIYDSCRSRYILMPENLAEEIRKKVTLENQAAITDKIMYLSEYFARPNNSIIKRGKYAYDSIINLLDEIQNSGKAPNTEEYIKLLYDENSDTVKENQDKP